MTSTPGHPAGDGLFNQHYKMMGSLAGAVVSNATFVLLPHIQT